MTKRNRPNAWNEKVAAACAGLTPAMRRALLVRGMSTFVAWERGRVRTQTMNRLHRAGLWVKTRDGGYRETKLGYDVTGRLEEENPRRRE